MNILSIETSCDETAASILRMQDGHPVLLGNVVSSQADAHAKFGGVVPQLAARMHIENIIPVLEATLREAGMTRDDIDLIAVTEGPGLIPALLIGVTAAKTLSLLWKKPLIGIHHIEGHIYANFINDKMSAISNFQFSISKQTQNSEMHKSNTKKNPQSAIRDSQLNNFPLIALVVSGGHTQLLLMRDHFQYELLGETEDDAVGEAFDKVARMLGLPYPGGPAVSRKADTFRERNSKFQISNDKINTTFDILHSTFSFPRPMIRSDNYNFSFSGLKTSVLYFLKKNEERLNEDSFIDEVCHEFQEAVVDVLVEKSKRAIEEFQPKTFVIAGGVSANVRLRDRLRTMIDAVNSGSTAAEETAVEPLFEPISVRFAMPEFSYSLDNAAMIGAAAAFRFERMNGAQRKSLDTNWQTLEASASLLLTNLHS